MVGAGSANHAGAAAFVGDEDEEDDDDDGGHTDGTNRTDDGQRAKLSQRATAPSSSVSFMSEEHYGRIIILVCEMRALRAALGTGLAMSMDVAAFDADLDDIEDVRLTNFQRLHVLQRMAVSHHSLLSA